MVKLEKVEKYFNRFKRNQIHAIDSTSLDLPDKGLIAILGNSGSGKTTLLNAIGGLDKVDKGKIYIDGKKITKVPVFRLDKIRNMNIGYIFQNYNLLNHLTVYENIAIVLKMIGIKKKDEIKKRVDYVLEVLGMYQYRNRLAFMLSGGQKQRVSIARAIVKNPNIIIADEPTGNLDSRNSIEIMNIIKTISKEKLVILVTHEKELAEFYASRIIKIVDGKIVSDEENLNAHDLDYRMYNKIYLQDMPYHKSVSEENFNVQYYNDIDENVNLKVALRNGNIYVESNKKIEVVDDNSSIELIDDHYKKMSKEIYETYQFNDDEKLNNNFKKKYASIYNIFSLVSSGVKKVWSYSPLKKILLLGFFISAMFIVFALSHLFGVTNIKDEAFVTVDHNYLRLVTDKNNVADYLNFENLSFVDYMLPGNSTVNFSIKFPEYYQTSSVESGFSGSLSDINKINSSDIILGRLAENNNEIVIDKLTADRILNDSMTRCVGIKSYDELIGRNVTAGYSYQFNNNKTNLPPFIITGIVDLKSPSIYLSKYNFINLLALTKTNDSFYIADSTQINNIDIVDVNLVRDAITLKKGRMPVNDYEIIVNKQNSGQMKLNKTIDTSINGHKLKVVGYYESNFGKTEYYANANTVKYQLIENSKDIMIYPKDGSQTINYFANNKMNIENVYNNDKAEYIESIKSQIIASMTVSGVILIISLLEIFLMIRSSFLSRKKEVGILRAIGVKRTDIYKMFLGEILAINLMISLPGIAFMSYIMYNLSNIYYFSNMFMINGFIIGLSIFLVFAFNILIGLLPVFHTVRKTPAEILSGNAID